MKKIIKNKALLSFLLSFLLGTIITLPWIITGKGMFSLVADYNFQQIPFNININNSIKEGSIFWTWYNELGSNFIGTYSFYNLFSPFNMIGYLFPAKFFPYLAGILLILKYAVSGFTAYLFLQRYVKNKNYAVLGSLLYSFSGFQLTNVLFFHFHDVVAFFPLLLYSLDNLMYDDKKHLFGVVVFLLALTNWFFFIGEVVFVIIYFFVKVFTKEYHFEITKFKTILLESILGTLMAAFVLIPTFLFTLSNPRLGGGWTLIEAIKHPIKNYIEILRGFLFAPQTMSYRALLTEADYSSIEAYLPVVGCVLALSYLIKNYKKWDSILLMVCVLMMNIPILNSAFFLFNTTYYARWFYMPILILSLVSIKYLDLELNNIKDGLKIYGALCLVFLLGTFVYALRINDFNIIFDKEYFILMIIISLINLIYTYFVCRNKDHKKKLILLILGVFIYGSVWGNYVVYVYKQKNIGVENWYIKYLKVNDYLEIDSNSRTNSLKSCAFNLGEVGRFNNIKSFNSNINGSNFEFYNSINYYRMISTEIDINDQLLNNFLGVKYIIGCNYDDLKDYSLVYEKYPYKVYYNNAAKDIGFGVNSYISASNFSLLDYDGKIEFLNNGVVLNEEQIRKYGDLFNDDTIVKSEDFRFKRNGFYSKINSSSEALVIYTVPYDSGFKAIINGKKAKIEKVDNGFMAIKVNGGDNEVYFSYEVPGLRIGVLISIVAMIGYIGYFVYDLKKKKFTV